MMIVVNSAIRLGAELLGFGSQKSVIQKENAINNKSKQRA
jgi:hypothetical protein